ncbi:hypothetical protein B0H10DRAFT_2229928 [Mycena sp. CBHHK59/15]|nr:hypothetical protein B0H10DRAFT_2229928 [Mycena sp. CBHHK59/15]
MTSRPKPYRPPKHAIRMSHDDEDDVFTARPSIVPKHIRLAMQFHTPSPPSSHSGRSTPSLSSGSSQSSLGLGVGIRLLDPPGGFGGSVSEGNRSVGLGATDKGSYLPTTVCLESFALVEAFTGIKCEGWVADSIENAFLAQLQVHELFGSFQIYLEWMANGQIIMQLFLEMIFNNRYRLCALPGEFLDTPVRPRFNTMIADIDPKYFILHKFVGDILRPPAMDWVPREQEMMFGSRMPIEIRYHTEGGVPGSESAGIVAFLRTHMVDLDPPVEDLESQKMIPAGEAKAENPLAKELPKEDNSCAVAYRENEALTGSVVDTQSPVAQTTAADSSTMPATMLYPIPLDDGLTGSEANAAPLPSGTNCTGDIRKDDIDGATAVANVLTAQYKLAVISTLEHENTGRPPHPSAPKESSNQRPTGGIV